MKRFFRLVVALVFVATSVHAQKIDNRLVNLLSGNHRTMAAQGSAADMPIDTAAVKQDINVSFNSDCSVKSFCVHCHVEGRS